MKAERLMKTNFKKYASISISMDVIINFLGCAKHTPGCRIEMNT